MRFALVAPAAQVWHAAPGQKNRKVLAQLVYRVLSSVEFNTTFIYLVLPLPYFSPLIYIRHPKTGFLSEGGFFFKFLRPDGVTNT